RQDALSLAVELVYGGRKVPRHFVLSRWPARYHERRIGIKAPHLTGVQVQACSQCERSIVEAHYVGVVPIGVLGPWKPEQFHSAAQFEHGGVAVQQDGNFVHGKLSGTQLARSYCTMRNRPMR